jgi:phosphoribosylglycinamide formyltransferase-1
MEALALACARDELPAKVGLVIAPREDAPALETARKLGLKCIALDPRIDSYEDLLLHELAAADTDYVCLAGYLALLPARVLKLYPHRVLNIHPALLPKYGGKGMYGIHVHQAVLTAREHESGCTVHFVEEHYDEGQIILQKSCPVFPEDTPESLATRVLKLEHVTYPEALRRLILKHGS